MNEELMPIRLAIFASGQGTNAREIIRYFHEGRTFSFEPKGSDLPDHL